ncbi:hypothetical protein PRZ48_013773 [Zasmidium cellare]|uniref:G-patch domain-containing protein n=1 Tax=Zasmidium cellare TaxID=395010 RepID=A0ABR0E1Y3_ZASCE|nr:hypothetical protein PRZ48_013773 [Zasmidium cellare]
MTSQQNEGFSIRGAASRPGPYRREERYERSRSPPRGGRGYPRRSDDHHHHRSSRDWVPRDSYRPPPRGSDDRASLFSSGEGYSDPTLYDDPVEPPPPNGDKDVGDQPWRVLLVRGLKTAVDEHFLAKGLEKLYLDENEPAAAPPAMPMPPGMPPRQPVPPGAAPNTLKRVFVIRDRVTGKSVGFGFAEYHTTTDAKAALAKAEKLGTRCTISSKQVHVTHPHLGVFHPVNSSDDRQSAFAFDWNGASYVYHDAKHYACPQIVNEDPPAPPQSEESPAKEATTKTKTKKRSKTEAMGTLDNPSEPTKKAKTGNAMVNLMNRAQARGEDGESETNDANPNPDIHSGANHSYSTTGQGNKQSFAYDGNDPKKDGSRLVCCFLCAASFPDSAKLVAHVQQSQNHADNYKDDEKFNRGLDRLKFRGVATDETLKIDMTTGSGAQQVTQATYVDRAKMRRDEEKEARKAEKLKEKPTFQAMSLKNAARKGKGDGPQDSNNTAPAPAPPMDRGRNLLKKAGWQEGQALGSGAGITAPIEQNVYAEGVGLGHASSKQGDAIEEAGRRTRNDWSETAEKAREYARRRYDDA